MSGVSQGQEPLDTHADDRQGHLADASNMIFWSGAQQKKAYWAFFVKYMSQAVDVYINSRSTFILAHFSSLIPINLQ